MRKSDKILIAITVLIAVATVAAVIVGIVIGHRNQEDAPPDVTVPSKPTENTPPESDIPAITPGTKPGGEETEPSEETTEPGHVSVDILEQNKENEKDNQPHIVGEPSVLPGVKEAEHEPND
jgi:flagellar basal body-associated protein FliL